MEKEITQIRTEFGDFKTHIEKKLDEIIESNKPQFTSLQISTFLFSLLTAMIIAVIYVESIKSDTRNNKTEIEGLKKTGDISELRYDLILVKLNEIDKKVDVNAVKMNRLN